MSQPYRVTHLEAMIARLPAEDKRAFHAARLLSDAMQLAATYGDLSDDEVWRLIDRVWDKLTIQREHEAGTASGGGA